jgi:hypothetical protein
MSADNYVMVRKFRNGWMWGMGFASDDRERLGKSMCDSDFRDGPFPTEVEARVDAEAKCGVIEYGVLRWDDDDQT